MSDGGEQSEEVKPTSDFSTADLEYSYITVPVDKNEDVRLTYGEKTYQVVKTDTGLELELKQ